MDEFHKEIDTSGLLCPLPVLRARKTLMGMERGQVLKIISTDQGSLKDFEAFCRQTRNPLISASETGGKFIVLLKKI